MTVEQAIESALKDAIESALETGEVDAVLRCWWLDDEESADREDVNLPVIAIVARPWVPGETRRQGTSQVGISMATTFQADGKRETLAAVYEAVRSAIDTDEWEPESPVESLEVVVGDGDTFADREERRNVATLALEADVCVEQEDE